MVTFNDLLSWSGTNLDTAGDALVAASHKYQQVNTDLKKDGLGDGLSGKAFEAEAKARRILADDAEDLWTGLEKAGNDLKDASTTVTTINNAAHNLVARIKDDDLEISESGKITADYKKNPSLEPVHAMSLIEGYKRERDRLVEQARDTVAFISSVYNELTKMDDTANGPSPEVVNHGERPPNPKWTPNQVNDWWTSLTKAQQENIIHKHPAWIGNLDGIPSNDRHKANVIWLPIMQAEIDKRVQDYKNKQDPWGDNTPEYEALLQRQKDIHALSAMFLDSKGKPKLLDNEGMPKPVGGRTLLALDNSGDNFRAAVASGDIDNADHVVVFTPGMNSTVNKSLATDKGGTGDHVNSTENIMKKSGLEWSTEENKNSETVAGVTWMGYDAPTFRNVLSPGEAKEGGRQLADFYEGLQATHHGDPHLMATGHSYGSLVNGYALKNSTSSPVDDLSVWGSPGIGTTDASDLHLLPDHMFSTTAGNDGIARAGYYGGTVGGGGTAGPDSDFTALNTQSHGTNGSHGHLAGNSGHSGYIPTEPPESQVQPPENSTCLHNQGKILRGAAPEYVDDYSIGNN
ncbi:hypothetical protein BKH20_12740 [Actinomyces oris]|uniref:DUF1023 domain-containing protein n=1 Tax=Actinomyces oris TaxID=544580 RepID=A0A1Q8WIX3_9ACTO|nr:alpha/beta hydrolase [Actinomyces oris]OLO66069.1 hypothetical protein BKH20_12740 [Actinomyces oris]